MNEWSFFVQMVGRQLWVSFFVQMVAIILGKCEWVWEEKLRWLNPRWQNWRWLPSSSYVRRNEFESDWISLIQSQSGVRVFWSESEKRYQGVWIQDGMCLNSTWQNSRWLPSSSWVRMNEWSFFVQMVGTNLGKCEWVWEEILRWLNARWWNSSWQNSRWLPSSSWVRMNERSFFLCKMAESKMGKFKMAAIIKLSENEGVWVRLN